MAQVEGNVENLKALKAITKKTANEKVGELKISQLNLTRAQKLSLRDGLLSSLDELGRPLDEASLRISIEIPTEGAVSTRILVDSTDRNKS